MRYISMLIGHGEKGSPTRLCPAVALALVIGASMTPGVARGGLLPLNEVTEAMMSSGEADVTALALLLGAPGHPLDFTLLTNTTAMTFSYSLVPGTIYNGTPVTLTTTGTRDGSTGTWTLTTSGFAGSTSLAGTGTETVMDPPQHAERETVKPVPGSPGIFERIISSEDVGIDGFGTSLELHQIFSTPSGKILREWAGKDNIFPPVPSAPVEEGFGNQFGPIVPNGFGLRTVGHIDITTGVGSFEVTAVPEPGAIALVASGLLASLGFCVTSRYRRGCILMGSMWSAFGRPPS
jgi:hypothetical protein